MLWVTPLALYRLMEVRYGLPDFRRRMLAAERRSGNQIFAHRQSADDDGVETNLSDQASGKSSMRPTISWRFSSLCCGSSM